MKVISSNLCCDQIHRKENYIKYFDLNAMNNKFHFWKLRLPDASDILLITIQIHVTLFFEVWQIMHPKDYSCKMLFLQIYFSSISCSSFINDPFMSNGISIPIIINWLCPFQVLELVDGNLQFHSIVKSESWEQTVQNLIRRVFSCTPDKDI